MVKIQKVEVVLATNNVGKLHELRTLLLETNLECKPQTEYQIPEAEEIGLTFIENALIKARNACCYSGLPSIADDSGLEVDYLQGAPGVHSSRFAGENATDTENLEKLLDAMQKALPDQRTARFHCVLAYLRSERDPSPLISIGTWEGHIGTKKIGHRGFGYDPIFIVENIGQTSAELDIGQKNLLSHRSQALRKLVAQLQSKRLFLNQKRPPIF